MGNQHTLQNTPGCSCGHKGFPVPVEGKLPYFWSSVPNNKTEILEKSLILMILMPKVLLLILPDPAHPSGDRVFVNG